MLAINTEVLALQSYEHSSAVIVATLCFRLAGFYLELVFGREDGKEEFVESESFDVISVLPTFDQCLMQS